MKNLLRTTIKIITISSLILGFAGCTMSNTIEKPVYKLTETLDDASRVLHFQQSVDGKSYNLEEAITEEIPAGTDLNTISKDYKGFSAFNMTQNGATVYIFYDRNVITYTFNTGNEGAFADSSVQYSVSGLYESKVSKPETPVSASYSFKTWSTADGALLSSTFGLDNLTFEANWLEKGDAPEGFVYVCGTTINGDEEWNPASSTFLPGESFEIPNMIVSKYEVTRGEYAAIMGYDPSTYAYDGDKDKNPAGNVTWYAAIAYCNLRSINEGLNPCYTINNSTDPAEWGVTVKNGEYYAPTTKNALWEAVECNFEANGYRLPTSAEWEYLARSNQNYKYSGGNILDEVGQKNTATTKEVGLLKENGFGIYDMTGNIWEWVWDPIPKNGQDYALTRGASIGSDPSRYFINSVEVTRARYVTQNNFGLRVVRSAR